MEISPQESFISNRTFLTHVLIELSSYPIRLWAALDSWLGRAKYECTGAPATAQNSFIERFPDFGRRTLDSLRLGVESMLGNISMWMAGGNKAFPVESRWISGSAKINVFSKEEPLGTETRALYQSKKGRDLFDLWLAMTILNPDAMRIAHCFLHYVAHHGLQITRPDSPDTGNAQQPEPSCRTRYTVLLAELGA